MHSQGYHEHILAKLMNKFVNKEFFYFSFHRSAGHGC